MRAYALVAAFALLLVAGCSLTLPVRGTAEDGSETFSGSATGYMDGGGTLHITSSLGADCAGTFIYVTMRQGQGTFNCTDGRSGPFEFASTGTRGTGNARLGPRRFTFTFGWNSW